MKNDKGKLRLDLIPPSTMVALAEIFAYGAEKYSENSWQDTPNADSRYYGALLRHLFAWRDGELLDKESSKHHLKHVLCNAAILLWHETEKPCE